MAIASTSESLGFRISRYGASLARIGIASYLSRRHCRRDNVRGSTNAITSPLRSPPRELRTIGTYKGPLVSLIGCPKLRRLFHFQMARGNVGTPTPFHCPNSQTEGQICKLKLVKRQWARKTDSSPSPCHRNDLIKSSPKVRQSPQSRRIRCRVWTLLDSYSRNVVCETRRIRRLPVRPAQR
jgi:hypothetical protein